MLIEIQVKTKYFIKLKKQNRIYYFFKNFFNLFLIKF